VKNLVRCLLIAAACSLGFTAIAASPKGAAAPVTSAAPPIVVPAPANSRIGIMVLLDDQARHLHVGTTRFQNLDRASIADWQLPAALTDYLRQRLSLPDRPEITVIEPTPELLALRHKFLEAGWKDIRVGSKVKPILEAMLQSASLDYLVTVQPYEANINFQLSVPATGYGIFTYCHMLVGCDIRPLTHVQVTTFSANPLKLVGGEAAGSTRDTLPLEFDAKIVKELPPEFVSQVREPALAILNATIDRALVNSGLVAPATNEPPP